MSQVSEEIRVAVEEGIKNALSDPETLKRFWGEAFVVLNAEASKKTGEFVLGSLIGLLKKAAMFVVLGILVYNLGGWTALVAMWKAISS